MSSDILTLAPFRRMWQCCLLWPVPECLTVSHWFTSPCPHSVNNPLMKRFNSPLEGTVRVSLRPCLGDPLLGQQSTFISQPPERTSPRLVWCSSSPRWPCPICSGLQTLNSKIMIMIIIIKKLSFEFFLYAKHCAEFYVNAL